MTIKKYKRIKEMLGKWSSFLAWNKKIDDVSFFENPNDDLLRTLKPNIIFLGKNVSRGIKTKSDFSNAHDGNGHSTDETLRRSVIGTEFYGAYFTDLYKDYVEVNGQDVLRYFSKKENEKEQIKQFELFKKEIEYVCDEDPLFIICGKTKNNKFLKHFVKFCKYCGKNYEFINITHYSANRGIYKTIREQLKEKPKRAFDVL